MTPSNESLGPAHQTRFDVDLRLIMRFELPQHKRLAEFQFEDASVVSRCRHLGFEEHEITAALALGAVEREIRAPQQGFRVHSIDWSQRYSDARSDVRLMTFESCVSAPARDSTPEISSKPLKLWISQFCL
jgi:hypothetical protein